MNPNMRLSWALGLCLLMWLPVALSVLDDRISLMAGGLYFLGFLAFAWVGTGIIASITENYRRTINEVEAAKRRIQQIEELNRRYPRRRDSDRAGDEKLDDDLPPSS